MQRQFRPKSPRGEPRDSHGQTLFMCKIKGFYCILVMHIVIFKIETPPFLTFSRSRGEINFCFDPKMFLIKTLRECSSITSASFP